MQPFFVLYMHQVHAVMQKHLVQLLHPLSLLLLRLVRCISLSIHSASPTSKCTNDWLVRVQIVASSTRRPATFPTPCWPSSPSSRPLGSDGIRPCLSSIRRKRPTRAVQARWFPTVSPAVASWLRLPASAHAEAPPAISTSIPASPLSLAPIMGTTKTTWGAGT